LILDDEPIFRKKKREPFMSEHSVSQQKVIQIISDSFGIPAEEIGIDTPLFSNGLLDSFHLVELLNILEKAYGRKIRPGEINLENLDSAERIARLLGSHQA
jgi:acyl carrier protein